MTENDSRSAMSSAVIRWLYAAAFIFALIISGLFAGLMNKAGLFYLVFGSVAAALMGFTVREIARAFRQAAGRNGDAESLRKSAYFWEAAARNAWILGGLGSALNFTIALSRESGGIPEISNRMIQSLIVMLYGLVLADGHLTRRTLVAEQGSDGMTLDNEGNLYLTGNGVVVIDQAGRQIAQIHVPDERWTARTSASAARTDRRSSSRPARACTG